MFHVEHMKKAIITISISLFLLIGCKKTEENPHLKDPFYIYYSQELATQNNALKSLQDELKKKDGEVKDVVPQSGQQKGALRRFFEKETEVAKTKQAIQYLEIKLRQRQIEATKEYHDSLKSGAPWPNEEAFINFKKQKKLQESMLIKRSKDEPAAEAPPTEGGHH